MNIDSYSQLCPCSHKSLFASCLLHLTPYFGDLFISIHRDLSELASEFIFYPNRSKFEFLLVILHLSTLHFSAFEAETCSKELLKQRA